MVQWKKKLVSPKCLVSVRNIADMNFIKLNSGLRIGGATTHRTLELSSEIRNALSVITDAVTRLGSVQVRNSATIGGNIANAAPSADTAPSLLVLDTEVKVVGQKGERKILPARRKVRDQAL
jgi:CO/xanthine dehydrogenase FAD-binding subunit